MSIIVSKADAAQVLRLAFDDATQSLRTSGAALAEQQVVQPDGSKLHVTVDQSALPAGAATSANQTTSNASLSSIDSKLTSQATDAKQDVGNTSLNSIDTKTPALTGGRVPVDGSAVTQPVSAASLPLPTGAATATNQTNAQLILSDIDTKTPALGQALAAASSPVVLPAAQITALTPPTSVGLNAGSNLVGSVKITDGTNTAIVTSAGGVLVSGSAAVGTAPVLNPITVSGVDGAGNKQYLKQITGTNALVVDGSAVTQPVSMASSPLPAGGATSANQTTANASLNSIDTKTPALGQALAAGSTPVVLTAAQIATLTPLTTVGLNTGTNTIGSVKLTDGTNTAIVTASGGVLVSGASAVGTAPVLNPLSVSGIDGAGNKQHLKQVTGTNALVVDGSAVTQPVSMASAPAGSATSALQTSGNASLSSIDAKTPALGQQTSAASRPVVIASDQTAIPVTTTVVDATASATITTQNLNATSGTATAGSTVALTLSGQGTVTIQTVGTYTGALTVQGTINGANWVTINGLQLVATGALNSTIASGTQSIYQADCAGFAQVRVTALAAVTGSVVVSLRAARVTGMFGLDAPIPAGANIIGALTANQSVNNTQINGVAMLAGNGVTGTGSQRVTIASDNTAFNVLSSITGKVATNLPVLTTYTSTPVTTVTYVQLVASTTAAVTRISIFDSSGQPMILATGAAASEVIRLYIPPGGGDFDLAIPTATRIAIKALSATANTGIQIVNLLT